MNGRALPSVVVEGQPLPMPRPRINRYGGVFSGGKEIREYKKAVAAAAIVVWKKHKNLLPIEGLVGLRVEFYRSDHRKPDLDNLLKTVQDALLGIAYRDDRQIVEVCARRLDGAARPRTVITVSDMEALP